MSVLSQRIILLPEDDTKWIQHLREAIAAGAQLGRKTYRIRNLELFKPRGENFRYLHEIHKVSKAMIGVLGDVESERHLHSFIDLVGTVEQIKMAEELIIDEILKTYTIPVFPVILMPPTIYGHVIKIHVGKVGHLIGKDDRTIFALEAVSGAWVQVDKHPHPGGKEWERIVRICGPKGHVIKAASLINSMIYKPWEWEYIEAEKELGELFKELTFDEMMDDDMTARARDISDLVSKLTQVKQKMLQVGEGGSSSCSCETEEHQHEEDVEEATSGEASSHQHV